jgi:hypothetical protein
LREYTRIARGFKLERLLRFWTKKGSDPSFNLQHPEKLQPPSLESEVKAEADDDPDLPAPEIRSKITIRSSGNYQMLDFS